MYLFYDNILKQNNHNNLNLSSKNVINHFFKM